MHTRPPRGAAHDLELLTSPAALAGVQRDASRFPGGHAAALALPRSEAAVAALLQVHPRVLPIGAQTSITGGATPQGELVLSTARLDQVLAITGEHVRVQAGVPLAQLQAALAAAGSYYPPVPAYAAAFVGGALATNAAGPATFKYGSTRAWAEAITVVLACGEVLDITRGQCCAHPSGFFEINTSSAVVRVPVPGYRLPAVPKCSAGYYAAPGMDLIDLFIGAEGTLGVITEALLRTVTPAPVPVIALIACGSEAQALDLTRQLRAAARAMPGEAIAVAAIEYVDEASLALLRADGCLLQHDITIPPETRTLLLAQIELPAERAWRAADLARPHANKHEQGEQLRGLASSYVDQIWRLLEAAGTLAGSELALASNPRAGQLLALREAVPLAVNARIAAAQQRDPAVTKVAGDMIVPFERLGEMIALFRAGFTRIGVPHAIWGHISDGNLHANALPHTRAELLAAQQVLYAVGAEVIALGGSPLAEHGVGRNPTKQALLRLLVGEAGLAQMRAIKRALDPGWRLAPGVLFLE